MFTVQILNMHSQSMQAVLNTLLNTTMQNQQSVTQNRESQWVNSQSELVMRLGNWQTPQTLKQLT